MRIGTQLGVIFPYKPTGASYIAQGPQKQQEILKNQLFMFYKISNNCYFGTWTSVSGPSEPVLGRKFHIESESEVQNTHF